MKKSVTIFLLLGICGLIGNSQTKVISDNQINRISELKDSITYLYKLSNDLGIQLNLLNSRLNHEAINIRKSIDSTNNTVIDKRLKETIKSAESTINFQNSFVQIFEGIFGVLALLAALIYFFSFRPLFERAENALNRANGATDRLEGKIDLFESTVEKKLNDRYNDFKKEHFERDIEEIFKDIESNLPNQRRLQIERLTTLGRERISIPIE